MIDQAETLDRDRIWPTITLGEIIEALEAFPADSPVMFDFCAAVPGHFDSWRGIYAHLALGWFTDAKPPPTRELLVEAKEALQKTFTGYKGGHYRMERDTPVWVDKTGQCTDTAITNIRLDEENRILISTRKVIV